MPSAHSEHFVLPKFYRKLRDTIWRAQSRNLIMIYGPPLSGKSSFLQWLARKTTNKYITLECPAEAAKGNNCATYIRQTMLPTAARNHGDKNLLFLVDGTSSASSERDALHELCLECNRRGFHHKFVFEGMSCWKSWANERQVETLTTESLTRVESADLLRNLLSEDCFSRKNSLKQHSEWAKGHPQCIKLLCQWAEQSSGKSIAQWLEETKPTTFCDLGQRLWDDLVGSSQQILPSIAPTDEATQAILRRKEGVFSSQIFLTWSKIFAPTLMTHYSDISPETSGALSKIAEDHSVDASTSLLDESQAEGELGTPNILVAEHDKKAASPAEGSAKPVLLGCQQLSIKNTMNQPILTNFSLEVREGDVILLSDESGSGKTTFIRLCLGFLAEGMAVEGDLFYLSTNEKKRFLIRDGEIIWSEYKRVAGTIFGYCPQNPESSFDRNRPLDVQLWEGIKLKSCRMFADRNGLSEGAAILTHWLSYLSNLSRRRGERSRHFGFEHELQKSLESIEIPLSDLRGTSSKRSYGFVQRLALQGHLDLSILFMDEPFNGSDPVARTSMVSKCQDILQSGKVKALIIATHDITLKARFSDRLPEGCKVTSVSLGSKRAARKPTNRYIEPKDIVSSETIRIGPLRSRGRILTVFYENFCWQQGHVIGVLGKSNSGKSMLGRHFCGWNRSKEPRESRHYVPQNPFTCFSPGLPVRDAVVDDKELDRLLAQTLSPERRRDVWELLNHPPGCLSGGQLQRLRILAGIATRPNVLFLDEPFAHQDDEWAESLVSCLYCAMSPENTEEKWVGTTILASHDIGRILEICNRVVLLVELDLRRGGKEDVLTVPYFDNTIDPGNVGQLRQMLQTRRQERPDWPASQDLKGLVNDCDLVKPRQTAAQFVDALIDTLPH